MEVTQLCAPSAVDCYTAVSLEATDCGVSCTGLYADIEFTEDKILNLDTGFGEPHLTNAIDEFVLTIFS